MGIVGALTDVQPLSQASNEIFRSVIVTYSHTKGPLMKTPQPAHYWGTWPKRHGSWTNPI